MCLLKNDKGVISMSKGKWRQYKSKDNSKRNEHISVALTQNEKSRLQQNAKECDLVLSEYVVAKTIYDNIFETLACKKELENIESELNAIGRNINQLTKAINSIARNTHQSNTQLLFSFSTNIKDLKIEYNNICKVLRLTLDKLQPNKR